jgi:hypothetical protein
MLLKTHWFWIIGVGILLLCLLALPPAWIESYLGPSTESEPTRVVLDVYGKVEKRSALLTGQDSVSKSSDLQNGDVIMTFEDSKVLLGFNPTFWLLPYSKMEFVQVGTQWTGRLIYGELRKLDSSEVTNRLPIELFYDQERIEGAEFSSSRDHIVAQLASRPGEGFQDITGQDASPQNSIEKQIFQTLLLHKKFFQTCFIKYYKNKPGENIRSGETIFDLFIDVTGTIEAATVTRSDIGDKDYLQCLQMVFKRMRFKNFQATESFHAIFPLQVELPTN